MSSVHDIERGPEYPRPTTGIQTPMQPYIPRGATMSPSQMTQRYSQNPSGAILLESPILAAFRYQVGIHNDPSLGASPGAVQNQSRGVLSSFKSRPAGDALSNIATSISGADTAVSAGTPYRTAANIGIYQRVITAEAKYHREYKSFSILINGALGLQIIFAAALTALGAGNGPHQLVTGFGALNTVLAGLLTFLKGSGLPNRLKYYEDEWVKVREYIEQRERDFASDAALGRLGWADLREEIEHIESMYEGVRKDIEANTPDSYISMSNAIKSMNGIKENPSPGAARKMSRMQEKANGVEEEARRVGRTASGRISNGIPEFDQRANKSWGDLEKHAIVNIREVSEDANDHIRDISKQAEYRVANAQNSLQDSLRRNQSLVESRINDAQSSVQSRMNEAQGSLQSRANDMQGSLQSRANDMQGSLQSRMSDAQGSLQSRANEAHDSVQSRVNESQQRFNEAQHHAESKAKEMEDKIAAVAGKAAEKVLEFTRHRHH